MQGFTVYSMYVYTWGLGVLHLLFSEDIGQYLGIVKLVVSVTLLRKLVCSDSRGEVHICVPLLSPVLP